MGVLASTRGLRRTTVPQPSPGLGAALLGPEADQAVRYPERFGRLRDQLALYFSGSAAAASSGAETSSDQAPNRGKPANVMKIQTTALFDHQFASGRIPNVALTAGKFGQSNVIRSSSVLR